MFKGRLSHQPNGLSANERRLAVLAKATARRKSEDGGSRMNAVQHFTHQNAQQQLRRLSTRRKRVTWPRSGHVATLVDLGMVEMQRAQHAALREEDARKKQHHRRMHDSSEEDRMWQAAAASKADGISDGKERASSPHYDDVDLDSGDSIVQRRFNNLVYEALLRFGPPLPPDFVTENDVITSSSRSLGYKPGTGTGSEDAFLRSARAGRAERLSWQEGVGADGHSFMMYDEVGLKTHELLSAIRRFSPSFSIKKDCDGVPFSLLIQNCPYFRAFGGKVNYMRYLRREQHGDESRVVVSIAKYKMRESAPQDGVRQGPQPWKYSYNMV